MATTHCASRAVRVSCSVCLIAALAWADGWNAADGLIIQGDLVTMGTPSEVITNGRLVVIGEKIVAVLRPGESAPASLDLSRAITVDTGGAWVFPGLIDAHNHVSYNVLPLYQVPKAYSNRYQWTSPASYKVRVNTPKTLLTDKSYFDLEPEVVKYAEVKAIVGGVTSIQGTPDLAATRLLVRNIENRNFGQDRIYQRGLAINDTRWQVTLQDGLLKQMQQGKVDAWLVHLAEGIDDSSRAEFTLLEQLGLLGDMTVIIHGTALRPPQLGEMAAKGTKLVWSPLSNMLLYGGTTDVPAALAAGVVVCLGTDWSPSGSKNVLGELKVAHEIDLMLFGNVISERTLAEMVTSNPAFALGLQDKIGQLKAGLYADIAAYAKVDPDPYRSLVACTEREVRLVLVGGEPVYGDKEVMDLLKPGDFELLVAGGVKKGLDLTQPSVAKGSMTFGEIRDTLAAAMQFDYEDMQSRFGGSLTAEEFNALLDKKFPDGIEPAPLDPIFAFDDPAFFTAVKGSTIASLGFDLSVYWKAGAQPANSDAALLTFVNTATLQVLDVDVGLDARAARSIVLHRNGADAVLGTPDDDPFGDVAELDAAPFVGASALAKLRQYAASHTGPDAAVVTFLNSAQTSLAMLDVQVGLDKRAAEAIVAHRDGADAQPGTADDDAFDSIEELDLVRFVGSSAIEKLRGFVAR